MGYDLAVKSNEVVLQATIRKNLSNIMLREGSQVQSVSYDFIYMRHPEVSPLDRKQLSGCLKLGRDRGLGR